MDIDRLQFSPFVVKYIIKDLTQCKYVTMIGESWRMRFSASKDDSLKVSEGDCDSMVKARIKYRSNHKSYLNHLDDKINIGK